MNEYEALIEEIKATITEGVFRSRMELIETYHKVGELIKTSQVTLIQVSRDSGVSVRTLQRSVQFYEKYPDINALPNGKNISWHKITNELLPEPKDRKLEEWETCPHCNGLGKIKCK